MNYLEKERADVSTEVETSAKDEYLLYKDSLPQENENINNKNVNKQIRPFTVVDKEVLMNDKLGTYEKLIYCILSSYSDNTNKTCYPSYQTIANKAGCTRRKAIDIITKLESMGLIEKNRRFTKTGASRSNFYTIKTFPSVSCALPGGAGQSLGSAYELLPGAQDTPKLYSLNNNKFNYIYPSNYIEEMDRLKNEIEYDFFKETMPEKMLFIDSLLGYIIELRQEKNPQYQKLLTTIDSCFVQEFIEEMKGKTFRNIRNIKQYMKRTIIEYLRAREMHLATI
jgi:hypothetical protein